MKKTLQFSAKLVLGAFLMSLLIVPSSKAASLINATDTMDEMWQTRLSADATAAGTSISVVDATGIANGDSIFITDGTNSETRTVAAAPSGNVVTIDALTNSYDSSNTVDVTVLSGIKHAFSFDTATTANIYAVKFTLEADATTDGASFASAAIALTSGNLTSSGATASAAGWIQYNADGSSIADGTTITFDVTSVLNPTGATGNSYSITVELLDDNNQVIDTVDVFFGVDTGVIVLGAVESTLIFTIEDDGAQNNSSDSATSETISLGTLGGDTSSNATTGYGVDGNKLTVSTNASNGYTITLQDTTVGLVNDNYVGAGHSSDVGETDNGINDASAGAWAASDDEAYGYYVDATGLDTTGTGATYAAFTNSAVSIKSTAQPITNEITYVSVRAQKALTTPAGTYSDLMIYVITPNF